MDVFNQEKRSRIMSSIKGRNTKPELVVRRLLHAEGYRYRIHEKSLPGKPDIYFSLRGKAVFVNGCFWHGHENCRRASLPKSNRKFWIEKIQGNVNRDCKNREELSKRGIDTLVVWECELFDIDAVVKRLFNFLGAPKYG